MIKYDRLWKTMEIKGITKYTLKTEYNVSRSLISRLVNNKSVNLNTLDRLCNILHCNLEDIAEHTQDDNKF